MLVHPADFLPLEENKKKERSKGELEGEKEEKKTKEDIEVGRKGERKKFKHSQVRC